MSVAESLPSVGIHGTCNGRECLGPKGDAVAAVLAGGTQEKKFNGWLKKVSDFILSLKTNDGKLVPVIFRPWHEMNGGWFWWGANSCTIEQYRQLYAKTYHTLTEAGCNNIVWSWSPNLSDQKTVNLFLERYPGSDYVDMIGVDIYEFDNNDANYQKNLKETMDVMMAAAKKTGKMPASPRRVAVASRRRRTGLPKPSGLCSSSIQ